MDGKKRNYGRFLQCQGEDDSDRSIDGSRIQEPPFDLRNRSSRGLGAGLNSTGLFTAGSHVWPFVFVAPPQQPPLAHHPAAAPRRSHEEKLAQTQIIKLLAIQEKTRTLVRSISKQLPTADHRRLFHEDVVRQQLHMERQHQSLLKQRLLSVKRANSGSGMRQYAPIVRHHPWPPMTQENYDALEARLVADLEKLRLAAAAAAQTKTPRLSPDEETPTNSDSSE
ncbi:uncharacterized protein LOC108165017 [Drosophila miranda]|uniref:uncharacterized protein LOC108165017 n=1 Tax=Drosophila miranda TaxID=7229 RepID=UPI0007E86CA1|nr:uncharacterized protein LOC108165017 [Drosophila miranda]